MTTELSHSIATSIVWNSDLLDTASDYYKEKKSEFEVDITRVLKKAFASVTVIIIIFSS